jgi:putative oxidoreductase
MTSQTKLETLLAHSARLAPTILRISLGVVFLAHAYAKASIYTFAGTEQFFGSHGFSPLTVYPVFAAELVGGVLLLLGVRTRLVSVALLPIMLGALTVHWANGWSFTATGGGWEYVAFLMSALVAQALLGPGAWALGEANAAASRGAKGSLDDSAQHSTSSSVSAAQLS